MRAAKGEIVAYIDDDAIPDPHWLTYLAASYLRTNHMGIGGPNLPPRDDGAIADCVANSPGGPIHVLLTDEEAEHIPGCNMSFRKAALEAIGGFDEKFRIAGDDVDLCWRIQQQGWTLGFNPAAMVWHHRRNSVKGYLEAADELRQSRGHAREEMARKIQRCGSYSLGWAALFQGFRTTARLLPRAGLSGHLGYGSVPVHLPAGLGPAERPADDARMVCGGGGAGGSLPCSVSNGRLCSLPGRCCWRR